jgi:Transporter associated domain
MFHLLGHVPTEGESVESNGHRLWAERVQRRRIGRVRIADLDPATDRGVTEPGPATDRDRDRAEPRGERESGRSK